MKINKVTLKTRQRFRSENITILLKKLKNTINSQKNTINSLDRNIYAYGINKPSVCKKEEAKCSNIIKQYKNI